MRLLTEGLRFATWKRNRGHSRRDARCQTSPGLPRQLCPPSYSAKPVSLRYLLPPVEVRGTTAVAFAKIHRAEHTQANDELTTPAGRATHIRKVPVRRVQEARRQDGRVEGGQGWSAEQLSSINIGKRYEHEREHGTQDARRTHSTARGKQDRESTPRPVHILETGDNETVMEQ